MSTRHLSPQSVAATRCNHRSPYAAHAAAAIDASPGLVEKVLSEARARASSRGASQVEMRDIAESARQRQLDVPTATGASPAASLPVHMEELMAALARISAAATLQWGEGRRRPRVLVVGETSGVIAGMFRRAGADVATCDLSPTETPDIPHYCGDAAYIQDLGWDLVVAHPPCTYLSNAGAMWLPREMERRDHLITNAAVFRRMQAARAPLTPCRSVSELGRRPLFIRSFSFQKEKLRKFCDSPRL